MPSQVPGPAPVAVIKCEQPLFDQRGKKLDDEEWVAGRFLVHQFRQRGGGAPVTVDRVRDQMATCSLAKGARTISCTCAPALRIAIQCPHERMD